MPFSLLLEHSLLYGGIVSLLLSLVLMGSLVFNPEIGWRTYPPQVKVAFGPMSTTANKQRIVVGLVFIGLLIGGAFVSLVRLEAKHADALTFLESFTSTLIVLNVFNLVDLLLLDWLIFATWQPKVLMLPGTEGMAEYGDYGFYFAGFLKGLVGSVAFSLIVGAIVI